MMEVSRRKGVVVPGSVWESRMKMDEGKGGFKVFNGEDENVGSSVWESRMKMDDEKGGVKVFKGGEDEKVVVNGGGSVWESRMKVDEMKGGIKVFNGVESVSEVGFEGNGEILSGSGGVGVGRERRKTWKCEPVEVVGRNPILLRSLRSDQDVDVVDDDESVCGEFYDSVVGIEKSPMKVRRSRWCDESSNKEVNRSVDGVGKSPIQKKKSSRSRSVKSLGEACKDLGKLRSERDFSINGDEKEEVKVVVKKEIKMEKSRVPMSVNVENQEYPCLEKPSLDLGKSLPEELKKFPEIQNKLESIVDVIMWRDMEESALVFGIGTLVILISYFTEELSLVSIASYMCLLYVTSICLYRAFLRESIDLSDSNHVVGEEEAISLVKVVLPYLNIFLLKLRLLFSGDPTITIKFAALLFVLARYGTSITLWRMAKMGFFAVFTLPKAYSWYTNQGQLNKAGNNNLFQ